MAGNSSGVKLLSTCLPTFAKTQAIPLTLNFHNAWIFVKSTFQEAITSLENAAKASNYPVDKLLNSSKSANWQHSFMLLGAA
jgi:hypothetical protein